MKDVNYRTVVASGIREEMERDENVFRARSRLPGTYWWGVLATALYGAAVAVVTFRRLRHLVLRP